MSNFLWSLLAVAITSIVSFSGALTLVLNDRWLKKTLIYFVSFAAGSMMGASFFHLLPEALSYPVPLLAIFSWLLAGFCLFFVMERFLRWRHCHEDECTTHEHLSWMNIVGNSVHNMTDGLIIFASFWGGGPALGVPVTLSIILHEVPQELGDFGILIYAGFSKMKALLFNFLSALPAFLGIFLGYLALQFDAKLDVLLLPLAAGGFIYIAASDLIPELHKDTRKSAAFGTFIVFVVALIFMYFIKVLFE
jgi:zinc and cadmium transporter